MIKRFYDDLLQDYLVPNKVLVIYGPRQVGKTTLVNQFLTTYTGKVYSSSGENQQLQAVLTSNDFSRIIPYFSDYSLVVIDEAQKIENIGQGLKIIVDQIPGIKVIATGSSSFDLSNKIGEPLVGRQRIRRLFPVAVMELVEDYGRAYVWDNLDNLLSFGAYPEVLTAVSLTEKKEYLAQLRDSYLYKDILELENIRASKKILHLLRLIAYQIGQQVSLQELGNALDMSKNTVARYLDLLEKSFVLINVGGFSRNLRKEITKTSRYYFYDLGVRNAIINNFTYPDERNDTGQLWENFLFIERMKKLAYRQIFANFYFWRTWDRQEIDLVEERDGRLFGYEFKAGGKRPKAPKLWTSTYPEAAYEVINRDNFMEFVI
jgi:predicted AAA+ superfamily ATPase